MVKLEDLLDPELLVPASVNQELKKLEKNETSNLIMGAVNAVVLSFQVEKKPQGSILNIDYKDNHAGISTRIWLIEGLLLRNSLIFFTARELIKELSEDGRDWMFRTIYTLDPPNWKHRLYLTNLALAYFYGSTVECRYNRDEELRLEAIERKKAALIWSEQW